MRPQVQRDLHRDEHGQAGCYARDDTSVTAGSIGIYPAQIVAQCSSSWFDSHFICLVTKLARLAALILQLRCTG
jgi:hypothetical protein